MSLHFFIYFMNSLCFIFESLFCSLPGCETIPPLLMIKLKLKIEGQSCCVTKWASQWEMWRQQLSYEKTNPLANAWPKAIRQTRAKKSSWIGRQSIFSNLSIREDIFSAFIAIFASEKPAISAILSLRFFSTWVPVCLFNVFQSSIGSFTDAW